MSSASIGEIWREFTYTDIRQVSNHLVIDLLARTVNIFSTKLFQKSMAEIFIDLLADRTWCEISFIKHKYVFFDRFDSHICKLSTLIQQSYFV